MPDGRIGRIIGNANGASAAMDRAARSEPTKPILLIGRRGGGGVPGTFRDKQRLFWSFLSVTSIFSGLKKHYEILRLFFWALKNRTKLASSPIP